MRIGLLKVGKVADELLDRYEEFPPMFQELIGPAVPEAEFVPYIVLKGHMPDSIHDCDAWLVSGSAKGVYDTDPWIAEVRSFMTACREARKPLVGVCFGHQLLAEALGGKAELSDKGWACGVHQYDVHARPSWMNGASERLSLHAMHRDQVTAIPEDATVLAASPFCPYAMLAYGDPEAPDAISIQPHPEFERGFAEDLVALRTGDGKIPAEVGRPALASYGTPVDNTLFASWIAAYLRAAIATRASAA